MFKILVNQEENYCSEIILNHNKLKLKIFFTILPRSYNFFLIA